MNLKEIAKAQEGKIPMKWNDPNPIEGNDYTITYIEDLTKRKELSEEELEDYPVLIQYGGGSEAEVYLSEIVLA
jgi:antitoxin component of RelBE/YafQ-DinJ toxin-antitoxin module